MSKISKIKRRKGFSLLELLLVLGIIAALIVAAFIVYPKVRTSQIVDAESKNIATIRGGLLSLYSATTDITTVNNTVGINAQIFPDNMLVKSGSSVVDVVNGFKGKVTLSATNYASYGKVVFNIGYANVPQDACVKLVAAVAPNMSIINIGGSIVKSDISNIDWNIANAATACNSAGVSSTISFSFY
ncbi:type 4 pilus major pilin [Shigella flexneri]